MNVQRIIGIIFLLFSIGVLIYGFVTGVHVPVVLIPSVLIAMVLIVGIRSPSQYR
ncbi:hypothetical protein ACE1TH_11965 [Shouchella sp. JSM 1781072]|uniref:hypothetical protein n=1 Tax=Bacillaceae TaxID=186817 RepID=UPI0020D08EBB|nr:hypothetical protein [Alkalihalobacillus sp. LMS6]UTR06956.1 hypothetical protein MM326_02685 [Alkalihalobacillus sp. LMS6]